MPALFFIHFFTPLTSCPHFFAPLMIRTHNIQVGSEGCLPSEQLPLVKNKSGNQSPMYRDVGLNWFATPPGTAVVAVPPVAAAAATPIPLVTGLRCCT
ncbi:hypothetical protein H5410_033314 [Solanum commersonii]|uniref:Uncharacterized protein n=1 Tax=Solanum commersonii TaxID=4109 RepID=A0A9J5YQE8_SOLCO|nr:hypothetical protein H5410_033314 [Solanum commersonii]